MGTASSRGWRSGRWPKICAAVSLLAAPVHAQEIGAGRTPAPSELNAAVSSFEEAWRIVHRTHYDTTFGGVDWLAVRDEFRPRVLAATTTHEVRTLIRKMLARLGNSHFGLVEGGAAKPSSAAISRVRATRPRLGETGIRALALEEGAVVARVDSGSPAAAAGVQPGWLLEAIDGRRIGTSARSRSATRLAVVSRLRGPVGSAVQLDLRDRDDRARRLVLVRQQRPGATVDFGHLGSVPADVVVDTLPLTDGRWLGFVRFDSWMPLIAPRLHRALERLRPADGMVIDLRGNGGGLAGMVGAVAGHFFDDTVRLGTHRSRDTELVYTATPRRVGVDGVPIQSFGGPVAILVDELTGSASEVFAAGMQAAGRARVFGTRTAGRVLPATVSALPNGDALLHAVADYVTADGVRLEAHGVVPDVEVETDRRDLLADRDPPREAAIAWLRIDANSADASAVPPGADR